MRGNMFTHHQKTVIVDGPLEMVGGQHQQGRPSSAPVVQQPQRLERAGSTILQRVGSVMRRARCVVWVGSEGIGRGLGLYKC